MSEIKRPANIHKGYHAHVYFEKETLDHAISLCERAGQQFALKTGRVHQKRVGPHPKWSCQILFARKHFEKFIPWLEENRGGLTIFVHGVTGDDLTDHTKYAYWLGDSCELDLSVFTS